MIEIGQGSFKAINFTLLEYPYSGGNRLAKFNYPGSNVQSIEPLGSKTDPVKIKAVVTDNNELQSLLAALNSPEPGKLVHPILGSFEKAYCSVYSTNDNIKISGKTEIDMTFEVDTELGQGVPIEAAASISDLLSLIDSVNLAAISEFVNSFSISSIFPENTVSAISLIRSLTSFLETSWMNSAISDQDQSSRLFNAISAISDNAASLLNNTETLANSIIQVYNLFDQSVSNERDSVDFFQGLASFGSDFVEIKETTSGLKERKRNQDAFLGFVNAISLPYIFANTIDAQFNTSDDLSEVSEQNQAVFRLVEENIKSFPQTKEQLERARAIYNALLEQKQESLPLIFTVTINKARALESIVYEYYGDLDNFEQIANLNLITQSLVSGELKLLKTD